jgi:hypothetical protein
MLRVDVLLLKTAMLYLLLLQAALLPQMHLLQHELLLVPQQVCSLLNTAWTLPMTFSVAVEWAMLSEMVHSPLPVVQTLLILPTHPLPPEVVRAELQVDRPVCSDCLRLTLPLVQTLSLEA